METTLHSSSSSSIFQLIPCFSASHHLKTSLVFFRISNFSLHTFISSSCKAALCSANDNRRRISSVESHFCYDKAIPEQIIDKPVGLPVGEKVISDQPHCGDCDAKGAVLCATCSGSGLYVDAVMECQGIIVKVRCLSCGGAGSIMCSECGGRGHL